MREFLVRDDPEPAPPEVCAHSLIIEYVEPRKRIPQQLPFCTNESVFYTIERDGVVLYDTRDEVPIDMAKFKERQQQWRENEKKNRSRISERDLVFAPETEWDNL